MVRSRTLVTAAALLMAAGCASVKHSKTEVADKDLARVPPNQLAQVNNLRQQDQQARDQVAREQVDIDQAKKDVNVAKSESDLAKAEKKKAEAALKSANQARDEQAAQRAHANIQRAEERERVAKAQIDAAEKNVKTQEAQKELSEKQQQLTEIKLEEAKYHALKSVNDPSADKYSQAEFDKKTQKKQAEVNEARTKFQNESRAYDQANANWRQLRSQYQAAGQGTPRG